MNEFQKLCMMLKVFYQNLWTLHHNLFGDPAWKGNHEWFGDWYSMCGDQADDLVEIGLQLGFREPTIAESLMSYPAITTENRNLADSQNTALDYMVQLMAKMAKAESDVPPDVKNKLQEYEYAWRKESYKLSHALGVSSMPETGTTEDDD